MDDPFYSNGPIWKYGGQPNSFTPKPEHICPFCVKPFSEAVSPSHLMGCQQQFIQKVQSFTSPHVYVLSSTVEQLKKKIEMLEKLLNPGGLEDDEIDDDDF